MIRARVGTTPWRQHNELSGATRMSPGFPALPARAWVWILSKLGLNANNAFPNRRFVKREYLKSTLARICRIGPAFGIGGVGNKYFRDTLRERIN